MTIKELIKSFEGKSKKQIIKSIINERRKIEQLADLQHRLEVAEKALELSCDYLVSVEGDELFELCKDIYERHGLFYG